MDLYKLSHSVPIHDTYGMIETPETSGFIDPANLPGVEILDPGVNAKPKNAGDRTQPQRPMISNPGNDKTLFRLIAG